LAEDLGSPNHQSLALTDKTTNEPAFLRETSGETSNKMVRLAFHPCAKVQRAICTLAPNGPLHPVFTRLQETLAQFTIFRVVTLLLNRNPGQTNWPKKIGHRN